MKYLPLLIFIAGLLGIQACSDDDNPQLDTDIMLIEQYLSDNGLTAERTPSGLHYIITREGDGTQPTVNSTVKIRYKGYFLDGIVFDETQGASSGPWPLSSLIQGWQEGIPKFQRGGAGVLLIPSKLGYGSRGSGNVPPNTVILFDVDLIDF